MKADSDSIKAKPETKPVGSANAVTVNHFDSDGFWMAKDPEDPAQPVSMDPDPLLYKREELEGLEVEFETADPEDDIWSGFDWLSEEGELAVATITSLEEDRVNHIKLYDSGASRHISSYKTDFIAYALLSPPVQLNTANQQCFQAIGLGSLPIHMPNGDAYSKLVLHNVPHALSVAYTLVSLSALDAEGYCMSIADGYLEILDPDGQRLRQVMRTPCKLYHVNYVSESVNAVEVLTLIELHRHLGHIATSSARKLVESGAITGVKLDSSSKESPCNACIFSHTTRHAIPKVHISPPAQNFGDKVHTDVWGPLRTPTKQGQHYFISFTDDATRYTVCFLLCTKDQALGAYKSFEAWALNLQHCNSIKVLCSDRGGEYLSSAFDMHLAAAGTARMLTPHNTPQLNGVAEHLNRTLLEQVCAFTHESSLPKTLWGEALQHAIWLKNRTATCALDGKTPFKALYGHPPDLLNLQLWGCPVWVHSADRLKLNVRAWQAKWIGFDVDTCAHHVYWPGAGKVGVERNVYFGSSAPLKGENDELIIPHVVSEQSVNPHTPSPHDDTPAPSTSDTDDTKNKQSTLRKSTHTCKPLRIMHDLLTGKGFTNSDTARIMHLPGTLDEDSNEAGGAWSVENGSPMLLEDFEGLEFVFVAETADAEALELHSLAEAKCRLDWPLWEKAIEEELATLKAAGTWKLEEAPPGANIIGSMWVFKVKKDAAGNVTQYKARLVAQGFSQIGGVDYDDTYTPVAKLASSCAIIAMANRLHFELHQIDIKGAYLNGMLNTDEVLFMQHPPGYKAPDTGA